MQRVGLRMPHDLPSSRLKELGDKAQTLEKLQASEAWQMLVAEFTAQLENYEKTLARRLLSGGVDADPVDQRAIDYQRGFRRGVQAVLGSSEAAKSALANAQKRMEGHA